MSALQLERLIEMVCEDHETAFGRFQNSAGKQTKTARWIQIQNECNRLADHRTKTVEQYKRVSYICKISQ